MNIAWRTLGEGPPLIYLTAFQTSHAELIWELDVYREFLTGIGRGEG